MSRIRARLDKLSNKDKPAGPVFVLKQGQELTEEQRQEVARAKAAGIKPLIINVVKANKGDVINDYEEKS